MAAGEVSGRQLLPRATVVCRFVRDVRLSEHASISDIISTRADFLTKMAGKVMAVLIFFFQCDRTSLTEP